MHCPSASSYLCNLLRRLLLLRLQLTSNHYLAQSLTKFNRPRSLISVRLTRLQYELCDFSVNNFRNFQSRRPGTVNTPLPVCVSVFVCKIERHKLLIWPAVSPPLCLLTASSLARITVLTNQPSRLQGCSNKISCCHVSPAAMKQT